MTSPHLFTRPELSGDGMRPERSAGFSKVRRGVWSEAAALPAAAHERDTLRYRNLVRAAHRTLTGEHIYSHESAMVLLGLPALGSWPTRVHLIDERRTGGRSQLDVVRHCVGLEGVSLWSVEGMLLTSPARTAFDIALTRGFEYAVVVADAVLRMHPGAAAEMRALLDAHGGRRGWLKAKRVIDFMDGRSGSVGESVSRVRMHLLGFEAPELQVRVVTDDREEDADFGWRAVRVLGEFDGELKYRLDRYRKGGAVEDVVIREKNRENRLRAQWPGIARWDWADLHEHRLERILLRAGVPKRR